MTGAGKNEGAGRKIFPAPHSVCRPRSLKLRRKRERRREIGKINLKVVAAAGEKIARRRGYFLSSFFLIIPKEIRAVYPLL